MILFTQKKKINYYNISQKLTSEEVSKFMKKSEENEIPYNFESLDKCDLMKLLLLIGANYFRVEHRHLFEIIDENKIILNFFDSNLNKSNPNWVKLPILEFIFPPLALFESDNYDKEKHKMLVTHLILIMEITKRLDITDNTYHNNYFQIIKKNSNCCNFNQINKKT